MSGLAPLVQASTTAARIGPPVRAPAQPYAIQEPFSYPPVSQAASRSTAALRSFLLTDSTTVWT